LVDVLLRLFKRTVGLDKTNSQNLLIKNILLFRAGNVYQLGAVGFKLQYN